jgi:hypothetical protein
MTPKPQQEFFPITKEELYRVKNDCVHPEINACSEICEHFNRVGDMPCTFSANALIDEILSRPLTKASEPGQHCLIIHSCLECPNRMEMRYLYKPYGMMVLSPSEEISDCDDRYVCTETDDDTEIKLQSGENIPRWCPLPRSPVILTETSDALTADYLKGKADGRAKIKIKKKVPSSKELILLAEHDWHCREERRHLYPMIPWTHGWMTGFLTADKPDWSKEHDAQVAHAATLAENKRVLDELIERMVDIDAYSGKGAKEGYLVCDDDIKSIVQSLRIQEPPK